MRAKLTALIFQLPGVSARGRQRPGIQGTLKSPHPQICPVPLIGIQRAPEAGVPRDEGTNPHLPASWRGPCGPEARHSGDPRLPSSSGVLVSLHRFMTSGRPKFLLGEFYLNFSEAIENIDGTSHVPVQPALITCPLGAVYMPPA